MSVFTAEMPPLREDAHGVWRVGQTRIPLDTVVRAWENGATPEEIADAYSTLRLADIYGAIRYYLDHPHEVGAYLARRQELADAMRRESERRHPRNGVRERLLARRNNSPDAAQ